MTRPLPTINGIDAEYDDALPWTRQDANVNAWIAELRKTPRSDYTIEYSFSGAPRLPFSKWVYENVEYTETIQFVNSAQSDNFLSVAKFTPTIKIL